MRFKIVIDIRCTIFCFSLQLIDCHLKILTNIFIKRIKFMNHSKKFTQYTKNAVLLSIATFMLLVLPSSVSAESEVPFFVIDPGVFELTSGQAGQTELIESKNINNSTFDLKF